MGAVINIPQDELYHLYIEEEKTDREIATIFNCCDATVREYRKKYNIPSRVNHPWMVERNEEKEI